MSGWALRASGNTEDPRHHTWLVTELAKLLGHPDAGTGSSEFSSPHEYAPNFHLDPPPAAAPTDGGQGGSDAGTGTGDPSGTGADPGQ